MKCLLLLFGIAFAGIVNTQAQEIKAAYYFNPSWSPDGRQIVFESNRDGKFAVYTVKADGSRLTRLTSGDSNDEQPRFSPDGKEIVFISDRSGDTRLYIMKSDGSGQRRVGDTGDTDYLPDFSPKGDSIVFQSRPGRASITHDIYVVRTNGTLRTRLTDQTADYLSPRWSPNGKKILFVKSDFISKEVHEAMAKMSRDERMKIIARRDSSGEIMVMNAKGSNVKNLTNNDVSDGQAAWSRDGRTVYFISKRDGSPNVYAMDPDGSNVRKIADGSVVKDINISPDGKFFLYAKEVNGKHAIYIYEIKTGNELRVFGG